MQNNVPFGDLAVFLAVLEEGGFRAAAKRLGVAPSKVSTTVSHIEAGLGLPLLLRTTRTVRATEAGRALADRIAPLLAEVTTACRETASTTNRVQGRLNLNVPAAVVPDILPPILAQFQSRYPLVDVEIVVENTLVDIIAVGCDAGIRYGAVLEKDMISVPIGPRFQEIALAASPAYLAARGTPQTPADLTGHDAIRYRLPDGPLLPWRLQNGEVAVSIHPVTRLTISVNAATAGLGYARAGLGIIATFHNWLTDDLAAGTLVPVLQDWWPKGEGPRLYYPSRFTSGPLRAFIDICRDLSGVALA
jgi:DNA-binding transcriptional LysR family regulator